MVKDYTLTRPLKFLNLSYEGANIYNLSSKRRFLPKLDSFFKRLVNLKLTLPLLNETDKLPKSLVEQKHKVFHDKIKHESIYKPWKRKKPKTFKQKIRRFRLKQRLNYKHGFKRWKVRKALLHKRIDKKESVYSKRRFYQKRIGTILTFKWFKSFSYSGETMLTAGYRGYFHRKMPRKAYKMKKTFPVELSQGTRPARKFFFNEFLIDGFTTPENHLMDQNWFRNFCIILYKRELKPFRTIVYYNFWFSTRYTG